MFWLNAAGICLVAGGTAALGFQVASNLDGRPGALREFLVALQAMETEIGFARNPLAAAMRMAAAAARGAARAACLRCADLLERADGRPAEELWREAIAHAAAAAPLAGSDVRALAALGAGLGGSDRTEQLKHLALCRAGLQAELVRAEDERARHARMIRWSAGLGGTALALLLL